MVLVSILGDFDSSILPIFFEFKEKITIHIILHDDSKHDLKRLDAILKGQEHFLTHYEDENGNRVVHCKLVSMSVKEDNYQSILDTFNKIKSQTQNPNQIYLNATDGLSSIGIVLSSKLLEIGSNVIVYDRFANTYNLHTKDTMNKHQINHNIDIKNHLLLKGYNIIRFTNRFELRNRKEKIFALTKDLQRFKQFTEQFPNVTPEYKDLLEIFNTIQNVEPSHEKTFLQGSVFEEYIYWLIKDNFEFDDIMTGVLIEFQENLTNEFDILMIKNNHLHTIECKFVRRLDGEHFVYKLDSTRDYLDDDGKAMIVSIGGDQEIILQNKNKVVKQFTNGDQARAKNNDIFIHQSKIFNKERFLSDIRRWFCV